MGVVFVVSCMLPAIIALAWLGTPRGNAAGGAWVWGMCGMFPAMLAALIAFGAGASELTIYAAAWAAWALPAWGLIAFAWLTPLTGSTHSGGKGRP